MIFKIGDKVRQKHSELIFTVEAVQGNREETQTIWSSELSQAYYESNGDMVVNWHNADSHYMELAEPIPLSYKSLKHTMV